MKVEASALDQQRLFIGDYPGGVVYADRHREENGDYARCAFLSYDTLSLAIEPSCPKDLKVRIVANAGIIQARRGQTYRISGNQTVLLGAAS